MNFGQAIEALKHGEKVTRKGWNGKNMFLWLKPGTIIQEQWCHDPVLLKLAQNNGGTIEALPTICMKTADNKVLTGWIASQTDILAVDWQFYSEYDEDTEFHPLSVDWDIPEEERVTDEDLKFISNDDRFFDAFNTVNGKIESLRDEKIDAKSVIDGLKKEFKMDTEYLENHKKVRTPEQDFEAKVQNIGVQVLKETKDKRLEFLENEKAKLLNEADNDEKMFILDSNFKLFEDYVRNH